MKRLLFVFRFNTKQYISYERAPDFTQTQIRESVFAAEGASFFTVQGSFFIYLFIYFFAQKNAAPPCDTQRASEFAAT